MVLLLPQSGFAQRQPDPNAMFERLDQNRDGVLTQDELPEQRQEFFDLMLQRGDTDQDGRLTQEEFTASLSDASGRPQFGGRSQRGRGGGQARPMRRQRRERFDRDGDGMVTEDEVSGQPFQGSGPAVGQSLPDLRVYDAQGREFELSSLKGNYSVLVFGCLT